MWPKQKGYIGFTRIADKGAWVWSKQKGIIWGYMFGQRRCLDVVKTEGHYMGFIPIAKGAWVLSKQKGIIWGCEGMGTLA